MTVERTIVSGSAKYGRWWSSIVLALFFALAPLCVVAFAQDNAPPPPVQEFVRLLDDPAVRSWLEQARITPEGSAPSHGVTHTEQMANRLSSVRAHLATIAAALPQLPAELRRASELLVQELRDRGLLAVVALIGMFAALGYGSERVFWRTTKRTRVWIGHHPMATGADRLRMIAMRLGFGLMLVAVFGLGSIGAFLLFDWPPLLRQVVIAYLAAVVLFRLARVAGRVMLVPDGTAELGNPEQFRAVPMAAEHARFWQSRLALFVGYWAFGRASVDLLGVFGFESSLQDAAGYILGLGLLGISLEAIWQRPHADTVPPHHGWSATGRSILLTAYSVALWLLWVAGLERLFWLAAITIALPKAIAVGQKAVAYLLRPTIEEHAPRKGVLEVVVERGLRAALIIATALFLADVWGIDLVAITARDTLATRLVRGALTSVVVLLLADFLWQVSKAAVDTKLTDTVVAEPDTDTAIRQARLRTLLPIFRNILFVIIAVLAGLTAMSALGFEIGPLIAGAGVFGVAVGFGAQTLVKDVISGIFYLLDDAFRVGEYIQSGSYKGTVEAFSLRSVKLRHHRGPVYTVPFGQLGAVENMSRDWVIDKFQIGVTYNTDLEKARKLIKRIGQELAEDPEFARHMIEPLKMQGVEQFGDYAIQIRCKMITKPGEQFVIRRKALARIKQVFDENGIQFATPTVQVTGTEDAPPAAARHVIERISSARPATE
jgi:moderate conductance mechanosensitive channel